MKDIICFIQSRQFPSTTGSVTVLLHVILVGSMVCALAGIKPMKLTEASLGIFMYFYANLPLVAPILLLCLWLLRILAVQGLFSK